MVDTVCRNMPMGVRHRGNVGRHLRYYIINSYLPHICTAIAAVVDKGHYTRVNYVLRCAVNSILAAIPMQTHGYIIQFLGRWKRFHKFFHLFNHFKRCWADLDILPRLFLGEDIIRRNIYLGIHSKSLLATWFELKRRYRSIVVITDPISLKIYALFRHRNLSAKNGLKTLVRDLIACHRGAIKVLKSTLALLVRKDTAMDVDFNLSLGEIPVDPVRVRLERDQVAPWVSKSGVRLFVNVHALKSHLVNKFGDDRSVFIDTERVRWIVQRRRFAKLHDDDTVIGHAVV
mmetsp:Transcript_31015/g.68682  ORF Transcript_31015/g.68682 Transcript_31015/m.68682 type:complete len:288 (+) Transcript_31015:360-1223(+)